MHLKENLGLIMVFQEKKFQADILQQKLLVLKNKTKQGAVFIGGFMHCSLYLGIKSTNLPIKCLDF